jgi:hypothetical protein
MKKTLLACSLLALSLPASAIAQTVDLNGIWGVAPLPPAVKPGESVRWLLPLKGTDPNGDDVFKALDRIQVNNRAAAPNKPDYKPSLVAKVKELSDKQGVLDPRLLRQAPPFPATRSFRAQASRVPLRRVESLRFIPTDGRPRPTPILRIGRLIGAREHADTPVVRLQLQRRTWLGSDGYFHSEKMRVIERFTRKGDVLTYQATVEDPEVLAKPWVQNARSLKLSTNKADALLEAPPCVEHDAPHIVTLEHH